VVGTHLKENDVIRKHLERSITVIAIGFVAIVPSGLNAQILTCQGQSARAEALRWYVQNLVSDSHAASGTTVRSSLGLAAPMDTAAVVFVSNDTICTRVTRAVDSAAARSPNPSSLVVVKFGPLFGGLDLREHGTNTVFVVDSLFTFRRALRGF
jgi:hypothetical protein